MKKYVEGTQVMRKLSNFNLIKLFFKFHDATQIDGQGSNIGNNYRSEIFYLSKKQKEVAEKTKEEMNKKYNGKIVTRISKELNYCKAENYHQKYLKKKGIS